MSLGSERRTVQKTLYLLRQRGGLDLPAADGSPGGRSAGPYNAEGPV